MSKQAVSVTLRLDNLLWLKTRLKAAGRRSLSEALDEVITEARAGAGAAAVKRRSVIGHASLLKDGEDGLLFASESADSLSAQMAWALQHPDELHAIGVAGRKVFEKHFQMSSFVDDVRHLLGQHHEKN